ncbi:MAG: hypothetical protein AB8H86_00480 [Polyangiales bacterium]
MDENDPDIAAYIAANKRARKRNFIGALRILVAGAAAAAAGLGVFALLADLFAEDPDSMYRTRYGYRQGSEFNANSLFVSGGAATFCGFVVFLVCYRLLGGKVDRETWSLVRSFLFRR